MLSRTKIVTLNRRVHPGNLCNRLPYSSHLGGFGDTFVFVGLTLYLCYCVKKCVGKLRMIYVTI